VFVRICY